MESWGKKLKAIFFQSCVREIHMYEGRIVFDKSTEILDLLFIHL